MLFLLLACASGSLPADDPDGRLDSADPVAPPGPPPVDEPAEELPLNLLDNSESAWLFAKDRVIPIALTLDEAGAAALAVDPYTDVPATVQVDGGERLAVGLRLRGKIGSFRDLSGKPKFKVDFNEIVPGQRFFGLETLALNNAVVDCSYLRDVAGQSAFARAGLPYMRTGFAWVTVNGADYGLYTLVEFPDDRWLKRTYAEDGGNLYDGKYHWFGDWDYQLVDFTPALDDEFVLEEGADVGLADVFAVTAAIGADGDLRANSEALLDWDRLHRHFAVEQWAGHVDGYFTNQNNYRVYFNPGAGGRAHLVPWDMDYAFYTARSWGMSWNRPAGELAQRCWDDPACKDEQRLAALDLAEDIDTAAFLADYDAWIAVIADAASADPRRECGAGQIAGQQRGLRNWIEDASAQLALDWD